MSSRAEFEDFVREVFDPLRRFLRRQVDSATAEDVLSETLVVCWRRRAEIPAGEEAKAWTFAVARGCLRNTLRAMRRQERLAARVASADPPRPVQAPDIGDQDQVLAQAMAKLKPAEAEILRLWAWEELTVGEISTVLGISANAASSRLHRAKKKLAELLRKIDPGAGHDQMTGGQR